MASLKAFKQLRTYVSEARRWRARIPGSCPAADLRLFFGPWRRSLRPGANSLDDVSPWMTFPAIRFLDHFLKAGMRVFEYGSGGSTLFFAERAGQVVSAEHDPAWATPVRERIHQRRCSNVELLLLPPQPAPAATEADPSSFEHCVSGAAVFRGWSFEEYAAAIERFPEQSFDVVMVDGRARPACAKRALKRVKPGGWLVLDNAERSHYWRIHDALDTLGWPKLDLPGPGPYNEYFWQTCAWQHAGNGS
jgi:hypothetical protein